MRTIPRIILALVCLTLCNGLRSAPAPATEPTAAKPVDYFIIITGGELLAGAFADAHTPFITKTLHPLGLRCVGMMIVDDLDEDLRAGLKYATNKANLVLVTGGLGPTDNDITRQTLSKFTGIPIKEHPELLNAMAKRLGTPVDQLRSNMRRQTEVPVKGGYLKNANGSTAGLVFDLGEVHIVALPGPPRELQPMVREELVPLLNKHYGTRHNAASITLRFLGLGQSQIDHTIKQNLTLPPDLITASQFEGGRVDFIFSLPDDSAAAWQRLQDLRDKIHACLDVNIYADDQTSLEEVVLRILQENKQRLALAEIGIGGALSAAFARHPAARTALVGDYVATSEALLLRLLQVPESRSRAWPAGEGRLKELAASVAALSEAGTVLVVGEPQLDAAGNATLVVGLKCSDGRWESQTFTVRTTGDTAQSQLVTQLLGFLWKKLPSPKPAPRAP